VNGGVPPCQDVAEQLPSAHSASSVAVRIPSGATVIPGDLELPAEARGVVVFAHGAGSGRHSPRNQYVAGIVRRAGFGTLLLDFWDHQGPECDDAAESKQIDLTTYAAHLVAVSRWLHCHKDTCHLRQGIFGSSAGGAAALLAATRLGEIMACVVSRGANLESVLDELPGVHVPTLLIAGGHDTLVVCLNEEAYARLRCEKQLKLVCGATHLFEESDALERVAQLAADWFETHLGHVHARHECAESAGSRP
jgi:dienelactone hydrolase